MLLVESGKTTQVLIFLAPTGLASSMRVRRKRGTGSWTLMTTPTIAEGDATNCPGLYSLLMDEDMTITAGMASEVMAFHIDTSTGAMTPVVERVCLVKNLPANVAAVLGTDLQVGGASPASPIGLAE